MSTTKYKNNVIRKLNAKISNILVLTNCRFIIIILIKMCQNIFPSIACLCGMCVLKRIKLVFYYWNKVIEVIHVYDNANYKLQMMTIDIGINQVQEKTETILLFKNFWNYAKTHHVFNIWLIIWNAQRGHQHNLRMRKKYDCFWFTTFIPQTNILALLTLKLTKGNGKMQHEYILYMHVWNIN